MDFPFFVWYNFKVIDSRELGLLRRYWPW